MILPVALGHKKGGEGACIGKQPRAPLAFRTAPPSEYPDRWGRAPHKPHPAGDLRPSRGGGEPCGDRPVAVPLGVGVSVATGLFGGELDRVTVVVEVLDPLGVAVGVAAEWHGRDAAGPRTIKYILTAFPDVA